MKKQTTLEELIKSGKITTLTLDRVNIVKSYIEKKYSLRQATNLQKKKDWDIINKRLDEMDIPEEKKEELRQNFLHLEAEQMRQMRKKMSIREFEPLTIIGRGAFGEVRVCRQISTGDIVAVKKMRKEDMLNKNQLMHVRTEREIMTADNPWIVKLKYSFQDDYFLYLVMDFLPGGDLMNLLMKKEILTEDEARFYTAEMIMAVDSVHKLNCIHRDLKPDNILIAKDGHIQLSDFGLSKIGDKTFFPISVKDGKIPQNLSNNQSDLLTTHEPSVSSGAIDMKKNKKTRLMAFSTVGTPDYIAPEVFGQNGYGQEVDWWSIGVMFFEMVVGFPPFFSENPSDTCRKIVKWKENFSIPSDANLSPEAKSLILKMVAPAESRLGIHGVEEIMKHPFFKSIDWKNIRKMKAPFIPDIKNDYDTKYFDKFPEEESFYPPLNNKNKQRKDVNYAGYTFNRNYVNMKDGFLQALEVLDAVQKTINNKKEKEIITDHNNDEISLLEQNKMSTKTEIDNKPNKVISIINNTNNLNTLNNLGKSAVKTEPNKPNTETKTKIYIEQKHPINSNITSHLTTTNHLLTSNNHMTNHLENKTTPVKNPQKTHQAQTTQPLVNKISLAMKDTSNKKFAKSPNNKTKPPVDVKVNIPKNKSPEAKKIIEIKNNKHIDAKRKSPDIKSKNAKLINNTTTNNVANNTVIGNTALNSTNNNTNNNNGNNNNNNTISNNTLNKATVNKARAVTAKPNDTKKVTIKTGMGKAPASSNKSPKNINRKK